VNKKDKFCYPNTEELHRGGQVSSPPFNLSIEQSAVKFHHIAIFQPAPLCGGPVKYIAT